MTHGCTHIIGQVSWALLRSQTILFVSAGNLKSLCKELPFNKHWLLLHDLSVYVALPSPSTATPRCPLFCKWAKRATKLLAHLFFIYLFSFLLSPCLVVLLCLLSWASFRQHWWQQFLLTGLCLPAKEFVKLQGMTRFLKREKTFGLFYLRIWDTMAVVLLLW